MAFIRQTWTLCEKTLRIVLFRHWLATLIRALIAPVIFMFFIAWAKNLFLPPSNFGVGSPSPLRSFSDALSASAGGRNTVAIVNNGYTGGQIQQVIDRISAPVRAAGKTVALLEDNDAILQTCPSSLRGVSPCFAAVVFESSPTEGPHKVWNYTLRADGSFGEKIFVDQHNNDAQIYILPLQHAIDSAIAGLNGTTLENIQEYAFTSQTPEQLQRTITSLYMGSLITILAVVYFVGIVGICYHLTGEMASERELGMSQLIESMMPNRQRWLPQAARLLSYHISFDIIYFPSWVIMGGIVAALNYPKSNAGIVIGFFIMAGLALSSWSIAFAALFRKAQLSGITVTVTSIVLAIIIQVIPPPSTGAAIVLTLLFPPINYTLFIIYMAYWQKISVGAELSMAAPGAPWRMPGYAFFIFCAIQIVVYPVVGALIERALYGTASRARKLRYSADETPEALKITSLTKHYPPNWLSKTVGSWFSKQTKQTVRAVDNVDFSLLRGQIGVLLGANGSGKSTTLDMLAGLQKPTSGTIEMDAAGGIGLCPQKNVLWDELTVLEHVRIFNRLKAPSVDSTEQMKALVSACDLDEKVDARTETLSGGQKRKCQLAMMLTGGSSLCMLDEVSSGLDPLSRRKIWDILLAERGTRSILLTTHFLDEADLLSDDIAVLSKGRLVAHGSSVELKHHLGGGYRARIYHENAQALPASLGAESKQVLHDQTVYKLANSADAARFIAELEEHGVRDYQVNGPTIEDVFLKLAEEVKDELEKDRDLSASQVDEITDFSSNQKPLQLLPGRNLSFMGQAWVLFRKRLIVLRRNKWPYIAAFLIPIIAAGLVTLFLKDFSPLSCTPTDRGQPSESISLESWLAAGAIVPYGPEAQVPVREIRELYTNLGAKAFRNVSSLDAFNDYIQRNYSRSRPGGIYLGDSPTLAWRGNYDLYFPVTAMNLMDISLTKIPIVTAYQSFERPWEPRAGKSLQFILYFGLALSISPSFFALYTNLERLRKVRALHYSNGIRAGPLWAAYTCFDFLIVLLVAALATIIFVAASDIFYGPGYLFVVFALYGLTATLASYVVSLFAPGQLATFAFAAGGQCVFFLLYFIADICIITYSPAANVDNNVLIAYFTIGLFFPSANVLRSLLLTFNEFSALCRGTEVASYPGDITVYGSPILYLILQAVFLMLVLIWVDSGWKPPFLARVGHRAMDVEEVDDVDSEVWSEAARVDTCTDELRVKHVTKAFGSNVAVQNVSFGVQHGDTFALLGPNGAGKSTTISLIRGDTRPSEKSSDVLIEDVSIVDHRAAARRNLGVCPQFDAMDQMTAMEHLRFYARARGVTDVEHNVERVIHAVGLEMFKNRMAGKLSGGNKRKLSLAIALMGNPSVLLLDEPSSGMDAASKRIMWRTLRAVSEGRSLVLTTHSMEEADALADRAGIMAKRMLALGTSDELRRKHGDAHHVHVVHRDAPYSSSRDMDAIKAFIRANFPGAAMEDRIFHGQLRFSVPNNRSARTSATPSLDGVETVVAKDGVQVTKTGSVVTPSSPSNDSSNSSNSSISALFATLEANKEALGFGYYSVSQATLDQVFLSIVTKHNVLEENYQRAHPPATGLWAKFKSGAAKVYHNA